MRSHRYSKLDFAPAVYLAASLLVVGVTPVAWAGAAEEVATVSQQRNPAFEKGDADAFTAAFADNAAFIPSLQPFRVDGRAAIKDYFATFFETYPTHRTAPRQISTRVYANDTLVVTDNYLVLTLVDKSGHASVDNLRISTTWLKIGSQWQIVDQHNSGMPIP